MRGLRHRNGGRRHTVATARIDAGAVLIGAPDRHEPGRLAPLLALALAVGAVSARPGSSARQAQAGVDRASPAPTAQALTAAENPARIRLNTQTLEVQDGGRFRAFLQVDAPGTNRLSTLEVAATVFQRAAGRSALRRAFRGDDLGSAVTVRTTDLPLRLEQGQNVDSVGRVLQVIEIPVGSCSGCVGLARAGVYPIRIELRQKGGGLVYDQLVTALVYTTGPLREPLRVAWILPFHRDPTAPAEGALPNLATPLPTVVEQLANNRDVPLTLMPSPETVEGLANPGLAGSDPALIGRLRDVIAGREVLAAPFVDLAPRWLEHEGLNAELDRQFAAGRTALVEALGIEPTEHVLVVGPGETIPNQSALARLGVERLVVSETALRPVPGEDLTTGPVTYDPGATAGVESTALSALVVDAELDASLSGGSGDEDSADATLRSFRLLAELSLISLDGPAGQPARGLALMVPGETLTSTALDALLSSLRTGRTLKGATVRELFSLPAANPATGAPQGTLAVRQARAAVASNDEASAQFVTLFSETRQRVDGYVGLIESGPTPLASSLERSLLVALAREYDVAAARSHLSTVRASVDAELARVRLRPDESYRLLSRTGQIPVTSVNELGVPVKVRVYLESNRIEFPDDRRNLAPQTPGGNSPQRIGRAVTLPSDRPSTERFTISTRSSGRFTLLVELSTPNGVTLSRARYTVRSTAASGVGLILTGAALVVFCSWWIRHLLRRHRGALRRHPSAAQVPTP